MKTVLQFIKKFAAISFKVIIVLILIIFFLLSIFVVIFNFKKKEILTFTLTSIENKIEANSNFDIITTEPKFYVQNNEISLVFSNIKFNGGNVDGELQNIEISIKYLYFILLKFNLNVKIDNLQLNVSPTLNTKLEMQALNLSKILPFFLDDISLNINKGDINVLSKEKKNFKLHNLKLDILKSYQKNINSIILKATLFDKLTYNNVLGDCIVTSKGEKCKLSIFDIKQKYIKNFYSIFRNSKLDKHFIFNQGDITHLSVFYNSESKKPSFNITSNFKNLKVKMPSLKFKKDIKFKDAFVFITNMKDLSIFFDTNINKITNVSGAVKLKPEGSEVEVFGNNLTIEDLYNYWPKRYLKNVSDWIDKSIYGGKIPKVFVGVNSPLVEDNDLIVDVSLQDANLKYSSYLPDVKNLQGRVFVNNTSDVLIEIDEAEFNNTKILNNSLAIFDKSQSKLSLDVVSKGEFEDFITIFLSKNEILSKYFTGDGLLKLNLELFTNKEIDDIFSNTKFNANFAIQNLNTPVLLAKKAIFKVDKSIDDIKVKISIPEKQDLVLNSFCSAPVDSFFTDLKINLQNHNIGLQNFSITGKDVNILADVDFNYTKQNLVQFAVLKKGKFCNTDFYGFFNNPFKLIEIKSDLLFWQDIKSLGLLLFIRDLNKFNKVKNSDLLQYNIFVNTKNVTLLNNVFIKDISLNFATYSDFEINSDFIEGSSKEGNTNLKISNLESFLKGFFDFKILKKGIFTLNTKEKSKNLHVGKIEILKYDLNLNSINLSSRSAKGDISIDNEFINIDNFRLRNPINTLNLNGSIKMDTKALNFKASYTLSSLDINTYLKVLPTEYVGKLFNIITFDTLSDGIFTFHYSITGDLKKPIVKFESRQTSKNFIKKGTKIVLWVVGANLVILPLLGIPIF